ncbi:MAG: hypothetical protein SFV54_28890 [Bryobacteraceae bacterium]|nr:hypothetical protein [Bryobacteraceae bacterium]
MASFELPKTIEGRKLNKRTMRPTGEPWQPIPFGTLLHEVKHVGDTITYRFLGEPFQSRWSDVDVMLKNFDFDAPDAVPGAASPAASTAVSAAAPQPALAEEPQPELPSLRWERLRSPGLDTLRAKVPGGWLLSVGNGPSRGVTFLPDAEHQWDGASPE